MATMALGDPRTFVLAIYYIYGIAFERSFDAPVAWCFKAVVGLAGGGLEWKYMPLVANYYGW